MDTTIWTGIWTAERYGKQQYRYYSGINTVRILQQGLRYENGSKNINQEGIMRIGVEMGLQNKF